MIKELSEQEFNEVLGLYPIVSFLGSTDLAENAGATIYLYDGKSVLISDNEVEAIQHAEACMKLEAESYYENFP